MIDEHDELVVLRVKYQASESERVYFENKYYKLFNYWNEKYPDEMVTCLEYLRKVELSFPDVRVRKLWESANGL